MSSSSVEGEWIVRAKQGSTSHFAKLVASHQQAVRTFLCRLCGNAAEADDLAQEVFITSWQRLDRFLDDGNFRHWLFGIAYRHYLANQRSLLRRLLRNRIALEAKEDVTSGEDHAALDLRMALAELPPEQRAVAALCLAADWSHTEAAQALQLPLGTVKSHIQRVRLLLQDRLSSYAPAAQAEMSR